MKYYTSQVTIPNATAISNSVKLNGDSIVGIIFPAVWTAAYIGLSTSPDDVTYSKVYTDSAEYRNGQAAASRMIYFTNPYQVPAFLKIRSINSGGTDVNQGGARLLHLIIKSEK